MQTTRTSIIPAPAKPTQSGSPSGTASTTTVTSTTSSPRRTSVTTSTRVTTSPSAETPTFGGRLRRSISSFFRSAGAAESKQASVKLVDRQVLLRELEACKLGDVIRQGDLRFRLGFGVLGAFQIFPLDCPVEDVSSVEAGQELTCSQLVDQGFVTEARALDGLAEGIADRFENLIVLK
jgi:hypothetical protein